MSLEAASGMQDAAWYRPQSVEGGTATILLVEDEAFVREVTCEVLRGAGYRVVSATSSAEGVCLHDGLGDEIDLLITDVVLPGENGYELAGRLRNRGPKLKVLFVTGYGDQMRPGKEDGLECLAKPFSSEMLLERVRMLLEPVDG
ncbi:MAG TPA: response regulator [Terriglobales bacterium]|nr:response regulator [Terriglobales bacterium]